MRRYIQRAYRAVLAPICAVLAYGCVAQGVSDGTMLLDDATSSTRVVTNAFLNASNEIHALIQEVSPTPDLSGYATTGALAVVSNEVAAVSNAAAQVPLMYREKADLNVYGYAPFHVWGDEYNMNYDPSRNSWWIQDGADYRELIWTNGVWRLYINSMPTDGYSFFVEATNDFFATSITFEAADTIWRTSIYATNGATLVTSADSLPYLSTETGGVVRGSVEVDDIRATYGTVSEFEVPALLVVNNLRQKGVNYNLADFVTSATATNIAEGVAQTAAADAVANADTTYRRTIGVTNLNQTIQYVSIADAAPTTLAIAMPSDGVTKDWIVYVSAVTNVSISLPSATWWMADVAYTNDVPPATPTAFYFSQIANGIFYLGRQELTPITITEGN